MWTRFKNQPAIGKLVARYDQLPSRDRQALSLLAVALLIALLYLLVWQPVTGFHDRAEASRKSAAELLAWMQANEQTILRLGQAGSSSGTSGVDKPQDGRALMALVTRSSGEAGLSLQRFEPSGEGAIRIWLENAPYADVAAWLERLHSSHGVIIDQAAMDRGNEAGKVSVRLTLAI